MTTLTRHGFTTHKRIALSVMQVPRIMRQVRIASRGMQGR
jgi:hypothetical protein